MLINYRELNFSRFDFFWSFSRSMRFDSSLQYTVTFVPRWTDSINLIRAHCLTCSANLLTTKKNRQMCNGIDMQTHDGSIVIVVFFVPCINTLTYLLTYIVNKKHLKNVGPICHSVPPHTHSPDVASGTVARRLRIDVHDNDNAWQRGPLWPHGMGPITLWLWPFVLMIYASQGSAMHYSIFTDFVACKLQCAKPAKIFWHIVRLLNAALTAKPFCFQR